MDYLSEPFLSSAVRYQPYIFVFSSGTSPGSPSSSSLIEFPATGVSGTEIVRRRGRGEDYFSKIVGFNFNDAHYDM
jgi:hypothetical protein